MASTRHLYFPIQSIKTLRNSYDINKILGGVQVLKYLTTSAVLHKRTPHTIGVMSWDRAAMRRKYLEQQMKDYEKSDHQILREEQLARTEAKVEFYLPSRQVRPVDENVMKALHIKPEIFLSQDRNTIVCYHPPPKDYPENYTKPPVGRDLFGLSEKIVSTFRDTITEEEIAEGSKLREKDPRVWCIGSLSKLFKVKHNVVKANIRRTRQQNEVAMAEEELYKSMSVEKRRNLRDLQNWERLKYVRETRGKEHAKFFRDIGRPGKPKVIAPPKF